MFATAATRSSAATIHAGDTVYVNVWNHPELSKQVAVDADGNVRVPLSGSVQIGGFDEIKAGRTLANALRPYVRYPAVSVQTIAQGTNLFVSGGPVGVLKYEPGETLATAIADEMQPVGSATATQSLNEFGQSLTKVNDTNVALRSRIDLHAVTLQRDAHVVGIYDTVAFAANGQPGPLVEPGDTIVFRYKPVEVHVAGDVAQPGVTYLDRDQAMSEAISQAGGLLPTASTNHVLLQRGTTTQSLALGDPIFAQPAQNGDVVTIAQAPRVTVVGMVVTPGVVALKSDSTLVSALYTAGGPARFANLKNVEIVHGGATTAYNITALTHGDLSQNPMLHDGDTVLVPRNNGIDFEPFFGVLGGIAAGLVSHI
jgi:protein involved in polysaccharide export with SLBB domain